MLYAWPPALGRRVEGTGCFLLSPSHRVLSSCPCRQLGSFWGDFGHCGCQKAVVLLLHIFALQECCSQAHSIVFSSGHIGILFVCVGTVHVDAIRICVGAAASVQAARGAVTWRIHLPCWKSLRAHRKSSDLPSGDSLCEGVVSHRKHYSSDFPSLPHVV